MVTFTEKIRGKCRERQQWEEGEGKKGGKDRGGGWGQQNQYHCEQEGGEVQNLS